ncbi:MAG: ribonuclease Z [candidate division Zixibacteria bacterium]|nr:ribonuclease Z [candidate division Zixibacteria bacterium]
MSVDEDTVIKWQGKHLAVTVLFSRAGLAQQIWIEHENRALLFDTGDGTLRDMLFNNFDWHKIRGIFYTHGHFDHIGGIYSLLGFLRMVGRTEPLPIYAPEGSHEVFSSIVTFKRCYPGSVPFNIPGYELTPHEKTDLAGMTIEAYPVVHCGSVDVDIIQDQIPAFGYRIACQGETVAISGDTGLCDSLRELVNGVDLAIIEATAWKKAEMSPAMLERVHLAEDVAVELGKTANEYILVHKGKR